MQSACSPPSLGILEVVSHVLLLGTVTLLFVEHLRALSLIFLVYSACKMRIIPPRVVEG